MTNAKTTKRALISSVLALFLCFAMLLGTTFAWFTDSVTSANNIITAGNLDVELYYQVEGQTDWTKVTDQTNIFKTDALWEPGHTEVVKLKVVNEGTLALKYQLGVNVADDAEFTNVNGTKVKLSSFIKYGIVEGAQTYTRDTAIAAVDATAKYLNAAYKSAMTPLAAAAEQIVTMVVYMPTSVGNEANPAKGETDLSLKLGINLLAIQQTAEADSFGNDYDEDALTEVYDAAGLQNAINAGETNITIMDDITLNEAIVIPAAAASTMSLRAAPIATVINLNGKTISNANGYVIENQGNIVITGNGTLTGLGIIRSKAGSVTIENGNFLASSQWQNGVYQHTLKAENTAVVINGGNFDATVNGQTNAVFNASTNGTITINGGSFKNVAGELGTFDPYLFTYENDGKVIINDGTFYGGWRFNGTTSTTDIYGGTFTVGFDGQSFHANSTHVVTVYGGTFASQTNAKLTNKLADVVANDCTVVEDGNGNYTVVEGKKVVTDTQGLIDAIKAGETKVVLAPGNYVMPDSWSGAHDTFAQNNYDDGYEGINLQNKVLTIVGVEGTVMDCSGVDSRDQYVTGATLAFENITLNFANANYMGFANPASLSYTNCDINGLQFLMGQQVTFEGCTLNSNGAEHSAWTWSGDKSVSFTDCDFTYSDRAVNCYGENGTINVSFTDCTFTKVDGKDTTGAIETNSSALTALNLTINNCSVNEGELWFIAGWDSLSGAKTTVTVNGATEKGVVLVQSGVLPYLTLNSNSTYMLTGDFGGQNVSLVMPVGVENVIFDGSKATNINELIILQNGKIIDNANDPIGERSGNVTVQNFNVLSQINVFACKTEVVVQNNTAEALMIHAGNCDVKVLNNTIDANFESHPTYRDANNTWNTNNYGIALNIFDYNLWLDGNTVTDATGHAIGINGWEGTIDNGDENVIESFKDNKITVNSTSNTKRAAFKVWDDETYASNDDDTNVVNATTQAFINAVLADGSNTFNIIDGYEHTIFSIYSVNTNN